MVAMGVLARDHAQLPIHDRQSDGIVGTILLALAWVVQYKLVARFPDVYLTLHLDLLALWMFLLGSCVLLFGTRPTLRHRGSWLILLLTFPFPIRLLTLLLGGTAASASTVIIGIAVASAALAAGPNMSRVAIGTATAGVAGATTLTLMHLVAPATSPALVIVGPAFVAGLSAGIALYIDDVIRFGVTNNLVRMPARPVVARGSWRVVATVAVATAAIAVVMVPSGDIRPSATGHRSLETTGAPVVPDLWDQTDLIRYDFAGRLYGKGGSMTRQRLTARSADPAWDSEGRRRVIVVDTITTRDRSCWRSTPCTWSTTCPGATELDRPGVVGQRGDRSTRHPRRRQALSHLHPSDLAVERRSGGPEHPDARRRRPPRRSTVPHPSTHPGLQRRRLPRHPPAGRRDRPGRATGVQGPRHAHRHGTIDGGPAGRHRCAAGHRAVSTHPAASPCRPPWTAPTVEEALTDSVDGIRVCRPHLSASVAFVPWQKWSLVAVAGIALAGLVFVTTGTLTVLAAVATFAYVATIIDRVVLFRRGLASGPIRVSDEAARAVADEDLPNYTVLVPAYDEPEVVGGLVAAMESLDYPRDKLQVLLLLEEDDDVTIAAAADVMTSGAVTVLLVPAAQPRTKPKASNFGLHFATGDIVTIYGRRDVPDPLQLRRVAVAFDDLDDDVACVQARLDFHNSGDNVLTAWFTADYGLWFGFLLPGLMASRSPIPLGGTSNHLRRRVLDEIGAWDPFNVTEDADLGIRIAVHGMRTAVLDSTTWEEANVDAINWIRQRSRWYKGYLQTFLVHMRSP